MSYDIYIGDAQRVTEDSDYAGFGVEWYVPEVTLQDAPKFEGDEMTGQTNGRHPGYSQWTEFAERVGLANLFFHNPDGLIYLHPGCVFLTPEHYQTVKTAQGAYEVKHPSAKPGWGDGQDPILARLIWLEWWIFTTLKTAEVPAIFNY